MAVHPAQITAILLLASLAAAEFLPKKCSVEYCGTFGASSRCFTLEGGFRQITCRQWASTAEAAAQCRFKCTGSCYFVPLLASDGNRYCRPCDIHRRGCATRFAVYGPVSSAPTSRTTNTLSEAAKVRQTTPLLDCSMEVCTFFGSDHECNIRKPGQPVEATTCGEFANTPESEEQCDLFCTANCLPIGSQPYDNERNQHCTICHLRQASCASGYKIYGPYLVPGVEECSVDHCTLRGADENCLPSRFHTIFITCGQWAATPEKQSACQFSCPAVCLPEDQQPIDNTGGKHCSECVLKQASCAADFDIFGPIGSN